MHHLVVSTHSLYVRHKQKVQLETPVIGKRGAKAGAHVFLTSSIAVRVYLTLFDSRFFTQVSPSDYGLR